MKQQDFLQDIDEVTVKPQINQPVLFLVHTVATFCLGLGGAFIAQLIFLPPDLPPFSDVMTEDQQKVMHEAIDATNRYVAFVYFFTGGCLLLAAAISWFICRKHKINFLLPLGVLGFSLLLSIFMERYLTAYIGYLMPGAYIRKQAGVITAGIINIIYLLMIASALFFSKPVKKWWLQ
jgi:hypothetical protein